MQTAYLIAEVIAIPLSGYLSRLLSTRVYFTLSALGFTLASLACALAWDLPSMILFRTLQGFLGGGMIPTAFAAMFLLFPEDKRRALPQLIGGLSRRKADIANAVAHIDGAAATIADMLAQARPPLKSVVHEADRVSGIVVADHDYFDNLLNTLPDTYQILDRQGIYGDFFSFYLCDAVLKLNGKGGQPVYVKVAGQDTGRCAPK